jgi:DNA mismatch repair protein MutL
MPDIIQLLPDSIANQIAAGEVVQRPASAVKELLENSIDAGATSIKLIIKDAGKALIQVIDDGAGMSETDARLSLERHATSKIRTAEDLFTLRTMGFRGEALASLAAVSQLELKTRQTNQELGTFLLVEASDVKRQEPAAAEKGTSISIKNLFYNIPARRNFLKSNSVEYRHIVDEFQRIALANPEVSFCLINGEEAEFDLAPGKLSQRIVSVFGKSYQEQLAPVRENTTLLTVMGYIGKPESSKKTRGEQFIFVNKRFIRSNYLNHAVMTAYEGLLPENSFPFYVLFIDIDPKHIDVNVHPTKTEIKFDDERTVYGIVLAAVRQALGAHNVSPAIDFNADVNIISKLEREAGNTSKDIYFEERFHTNLERSNLKNWEKLVTGMVPEQFRQPESADQAQLLRFNSAVNNPGETKQPGEKWLVQLHERFILRPVRAGLMIIDQQLAHERILYEKNIEKLTNRSGESQQSLFPQSITLSASDFAMIMEMEQEINSMGFRLELFGKNTLLVTGIPSHLAAGQEKGLFEGLIEQFKINQAELSLPLNENLARALARRAGIKHGQILQREEMNSIIGQLFSCKTPNYTPDGKPTFFIFELAKMDNYF